MKIRSVKGRFWLWNLALIFAAFHCFAEDTTTSGTGKSNVDVSPPALSGAPNSTLSSPSNSKPDDTKSTVNATSTGELKSTAEQKIEDDKKVKDAKPTNDEGKKKEAATGSDITNLAELISPPEPTPDEIAKRNDKASEYRTLGERTFGFPVTGSVLTRYRFREGAGQSDQDLEEFITVDVGNKERDFATGHLDALAYQGLDKHHPVSSGIFTGLLDTYNRPFEERLYSAYVDFNRLEGIDFLRVGRQFDYDTPDILQYDGARLATKPFQGLNDLTFTFYGGAAVHEYESSSQGDWLVGTAAEFKPWERGKIRFDYVHINDSFADWVIASPDPLPKSLSPNGSTRSNDLASLSFWQAFKNPDIHLNGHFGLIDGQPRDLSVRTVYNNTENRLQVTGTYNVWFKPDTQFVTEFDPYYETLKGLEPYQNGRVNINKGFLEWLWLDVGANSRRLVGNSVAKEFNREFDNFYATLETHDVLLKGLRMNATVTHWEGKDQAPTTTQFGGEISYEWRKHLETIIGTDYALYKYDLFQNTEHDQDRTIYLRQRWRPTRWASIDARYEYERTQSHDFHTFQLQFHFDF